MTLRSYTRIAALAGAVAALIAGALALWLSTGPSGHAASVPEFQGTTVTVQGKEISWGAGGQCDRLRSDLGLPAPAITANFGVSPPGGGAVSSQPFSGCVTSNATWSVEALATALTSGADSIPADRVNLTAAGLSDSLFPGYGDPSPAPIAPDCDDSIGAYCSLGTTRTVVVGAAPSPQSSGFVYSYRLDVPGSAPAGTYTGSVTLTASN